MKKEVVHVGDGVDEGSLRAIRFEAFDEHINLLEIFTGQELVHSMFGDLPGFRDHGDGTWSINDDNERWLTPEQLRRRAKRRNGGSMHTSIAEKRRWAKKHREMCARAEAHHRKLLGLGDAEDT